ncbi:OLC1v1024771C1 [Oldenlandia corymbosa var. corymbosa]|uniref:OLC1v1024771C1 n=1 Tax=Oldenlandia corymbosa var. corymbosa TaxID=529605 RepID=A0AAV1C420_OLDCO|nr:OLC1v1024771C1 [Oldenlandia corymbosa var. corymbosa]
MTIKSLQASQRQLEARLSQNEKLCAGRLAGSLLSDTMEYRRAVQQEQAKVVSLCSGKKLTSTSEVPILPPVAVPQEAEDIIDLTEEREDAVDQRLQKQEEWRIYEEKQAMLQQIYDSQETRRQETLNSQELMQQIQIQMQRIVESTKKMESSFQQYAEEEEIRLKSIALEEEKEECEEWQHEFEQEIQDLVLEENFSNKNSFIFSISYPQVESVVEENNSMSLDSNILHLEVDIEESNDLSLFEEVESKKQDFSLMDNFYDIFDSITVPLEEEVHRALNSMSRWNYYQISGVAGHVPIISTSCSLKVVDEHEDIILMDSYEEIEHIDFVFGDTFSWEVLVPQNFSKFWIVDGQWMFVKKHKKTMTNLFLWNNMKHDSSTNRFKEGGYDVIPDGPLSVIPNYDDHYIDYDHIGAVCCHIEVGIKDDGRLKPKYGSRQARIKSTMKSKESRRHDGPANEVDEKANKVCINDLVGKKQLIKRNDVDIVGNQA